MTPPTHLPADALPDLRDIAPGVPWVGPVEIHAKLSEDRWEWLPAAWPHIDKAERQHVRLPMTRPECRAQLCRVLARGLKCPFCGGTGNYNPTVMCGECVGTGYTRKPAPLFWALPMDEGGTLDATLAPHSAPVLTAHALLVAAGGPGIRGLALRGRPLPLTRLRPWRIVCGRALDDADAVAGLLDSTTPAEVLASRGYAVVADGALTLPERA